VASSLLIAIDGRELIGAPTGVGRYLRSLLEAWSADGQAHRFRVFLPASPTPALIALGDRFSWTVEPTRRPGTWWEQTRLATSVTAARPDVFFGPGYTAPLRLRCPNVIAVHDVSFFAHPEWFTAREGFLRRRLTRASARRADAILTLTECSAAELERWLRVPRERIHLAPPGAPPYQRRVRADGRPPTVLYVGSLFTRRHIPELLKAFALASARIPEATLVLVGANRTTPRIDPRAQAIDLGIGDRVTWMDYVSDDTLAGLYSGATVFAFLSEYEGFGMTPLEAISHGVPPVLLDTPVFREVYGDAATFVPVEPAAIADALVTLVTDDRAHATLTASGPACLARYSWPKTADTITRVLEDVV
jgi:glycosyltransferase involved in cell wall biosynthesis